MKLNNRKGFTLIELLVVIIIVALVIGFSTYGIIKILNNSKEQSITLTEENILETARIYSSEASSDSWKGTNNDYDVFCVTIGELMNKGLLEKNSTIENKNINKNTYVAVKRNKVTLAVEKEEFALSAINEENICTGEYISNNVDITKPKVGTSISYTDKIQITFENGSISSNGTTSPVTYKCLYGTNSSNVNKEGIISGNNCILNNLKSNSDYYVLIYMNSNNGVSVVAEGNNNFKTTDFVVPTINQDKNNVTINYTDIDNNGNPINNPSHYFKSSINAVSNIQIEKCTIKNEILSCSDKTNNIEANVWYKVSAPNVIVTYPEANNTVVINARIYDGSNNYGESTNNYKINKYTVKFHKGNAISIDGNTSNYIEKYCISGGNDSCEITSPIITPPTGYSTVGWNTDSSATTSSWNQNTKKNINNDYNYYPILKINYVYTITYDANGGTGAPKSQTYTYDPSGTSTINLSSAKPTRTGYTFLGWSLDKNATTESYYANEVWNCNNNNNYTLYAVWKDTLGPTITFGTDGNSSYSKSAESKITVTDGGSGGNTATYKYIYSVNDSATPSTTFASGSSYSISSKTGIYYLIAYACDKANNCTTKVSNKFYLDNESPTCSLSVTTSGIKFKETKDNIGVTSSGLSTSTTTSYGTTSLSLSTGTKYGYVKDSAGNTGDCSVTIKSTTETNTCPQYYTACSSGTDCQCFRTLSPTTTVEGSCKCKDTTSGKAANGTCKTSGCSCPADSTYEVTTNLCEIKYSCSSGSLGGNNKCYLYTSYESTTYSCQEGYTKLNNSYCYK